MQKSLLRAKARGCKIIVMNASQPSIRKLYKGIGKSITLERYSVISGLNRGRKIEKELMILVD